MLTVGKFGALGFSRVRNLICTVVPRPGAEIASSPAPTAPADRPGALSKVAEAHAGGRVGRVEAAPVVAEAKQ